MSAQPQSLGTTLSQLVAWAFTRREVIPVGGVILGREKGRPVVDESMAPVLVVGPCRVGKTSAVVIPTLLTWRQSAVVLDVQGEAESIAVNWRKTGSKVRRLDFTENESVESYNPLDAIRTDTEHELSDLMLIAQVLLPDTDTEAHELARGVLVGIMHSIKRAGNGLASAFNVLNSMEDLGAFLRLWTLRTVTTQAERFAADASNAYFRAGYEDRLGVIAFLRTALLPFDDPIIAKNTAVSTFNLAELRNPDPAQTLFIKVRPSELERVRPLLKTLFSQIAMTGDENAAPLLMVIDEMTSVGPFHLIHNELHHLAQRRIKLIAIVQAVSDIEAQYGEHSKFWPCDPSPLIRLAFEPREDGERQRLAEAMDHSNRNHAGSVVATLESPRLIVFWPNNPAKFIEPLRYFESESYCKRAAAQ